MKRARDAGEKLGAIHLRHVHPLPNGLEKIFAGFKRIVVVEMNDEGLYGFGQLATILRARYCEPKIESITKTDGLTFRVKEILERVFEGRLCRRIRATEHRHRHADVASVEVATARAEEEVSTARRSRRRTSRSARDLRSCDPEQRPRFRCLDLAPTDSHLRIP